MSLERLTAMRQLVLASCLLAACASGPAGFKSEGTRPTQCEDQACGGTMPTPALGLVGLAVLVGVTLVDRWR